MILILPDREFMFQPTRPPVLPGSYLSKGKSKLITLTYGCASFYINIVSDSAWFEELPQFIWVRAEMRGGEVIRRFVKKSSIFSLFGLTRLPRSGNRCGELWLFDHILHLSVSLLLTALETNADRASVELHTQHDTQRKRGPLQLHTGRFLVKLKQVKTGRHGAR
jgi:hypothetical protein